MKKEVLAYFRALSTHLPGGTKTNRLCPDPHSNRELTEYKSKSLSLEANLLDVTQKACSVYSLTTVNQIEKKMNVEFDHKT